MTDAEKIKARLITAYAGMMISVMNEAFGEMAKELRRYAGSDFKKRLDEFEAKAIRNVKNAPLDTLPENEQLMLVEHTRNAISAIFKFAREIK